MTGSLTSGHPWGLAPIPEGLYGEVCPVWPECGLSSLSRPLALPLSRKYLLTGPPSSWFCKKQQNSSFWFFPFFSYLRILFGLPSDCPVLSLRHVASGHVSSQMCTLLNAQSSGPRSGSTCASGASGWKRRGARGAEGMRSTAGERSALGKSGDGPSGQACRGPQ